VKIGGITYGQKVDLLCNLKDVEWLSQTLEINGSTQFGTASWSHATFQLFDRREFYRTVLFFIVNADKKKVASRGLYIYIYIYIYNEIEIEIQYIYIYIYINGCIVSAIL